LNDSRRLCYRVIMPQPVRIAVIIPAGPRDDIADTLASVVQYTDSSRIIAVVNDTSRVLSFSDLSSDITVLDPAPARPGTDGGLWIKVAAAYRWVIEQFQPGVILRLDADALILRSGIEAAAEEAFARHPEAGLLGSYKVGPDGNPRDFQPVVRQLRNETGLPGLRHPRLWAGLRRHVKLAREHGYADGEHVLGCAYVHSFTAVEKIYRNGWLDQPWMEASKLGDDQIMSLLTVASGYQIADFGGPSDPLAVKWRGLPAHPDELLAKGKLITHSVRSWESLAERQIRDIFAAARTSARSI
jgi:hypothetical protein